MSFDDGSREWMNPPPPGTSDDTCCNSKEKYSSYDRYETKKDVRRYSHSPNRSYNDSYSSYRSRSPSRDHYSKYFRDRYRRSRSRDHRRYRSRSGSRKRHLNRKYSHKSYRNKYSRSRSRSRSRRHRKSYSRSRSPSLRRRQSSHSRSYSSSSNSDQDSYAKHRKAIDIEKSKRLPSKHAEHREEVDEDDDELEPVQENTFKNDGSFLEMFKKMQEQQAKEQQAKAEQPEANTSEVKKTPIFGKRRGGRILKTGVVQKLKNPNEVEEEPKDAWSVYMKEVRKYKEACCDDDSKTRPLVK